MICDGTENAGDCWRQDGNCMEACKASEFIEVDTSKNKRSDMIDVNVEIRTNQTDVLCPSIIFACSARPVP